MTLLLTKNNDLIDMESRVFQVETDPRVIQLFLSPCEIDFFTTTRITSQLRQYLYVVQTWTGGVRKKRYLTLPLDASFPEQNFDKSDHLGARPSLKQKVSHSKSNPQTSSLNDPHFIRECFVSPTILWHRGIFWRSFHFDFAATHASTSKTYEFCRCISNVVHWQLLRWKTLKNSLYVINLLKDILYVSWNKENGYHSIAVIQTLKWKFSNTICHKVPPRPSIYTKNCRF